MTSSMSSFVSGLLAAGYWVAALFFLRYWKYSRDRLFAMFSAAFWLLGAQRIVLSLAMETDQQLLWPYLARLAAFLLILWAIIDKNWAQD